MIDRIFLGAPEDRQEGVNRLSALKERAFPSGTHFLVMRCSIQGKKLS